ncbi:glycosyltransferase family 4 protein [Kushneria sp. Sum13]|uniref:glycosyltransferase family 4 protein n=1 Tax=Kushneria sp. Sum13 TaxID=3459196 RepID=UPI0040457253
MNPTHFIRLQELAGTEMMLFSLLSRWQADHRIVTTTRIPDNVRVEVKPQWQTHRHKAPLGVHLPRFLNSMRPAIWQRVLGESDLLISWSQFKGKDLARAFKKRGRPVVHYDHGSAWSVDVMRGQRWLKEVDRIVCVSHAGKRMIELRLGVTDVPMDVCFNPSRRSLIEHRFGVSEISDRQKTDDTLVIGMAGRLTPVKGMLIALQAMRHLLDAGIKARLEIAGSGEQRDVIETSVASLGLEHAVTLLGHVSHMGQFYHGLDLFWSTAVRDPCPLTTLEALSYGVPVIASRVDGFPEQIREGETGYTLCCTQPLKSRPWLEDITGIATQVYDPDLDELRAPMAVDPQALAERTIAIVQTPGELTRLQRQALHDGVERFGFEAYYRRITNALTGKSL